MASRYEKLEDKIEELRKEHNEDIEELEKKYISRREVAPWIKIFQGVILAIAVMLATALLNVVLK